MISTIGRYTMSLFFFATVAGAFGCEGPGTRGPDNGGAGGGGSGGHGGPPSSSGGSPGAGDGGVGCAVANGRTGGQGPPTDAGPGQVDVGATSWSYPPPPWREADTDENGLAGSVACSAGKLAIAGSGHGFHAEASSDGFYYVYQPVEGDFDVSAKLDGAAGHNDSQVGLVFRAAEGLRPSATDSTVAVMTHTDGPSYGFYIRANDGAPLQRFEFDAAAPFPRVYLRLRRSNGYFFAYHSTTGLPGSWKLVPPTGGLVPNRGWIGFAVTSQNQESFARAVISESQGFAHPLCAAPN